MIKKIHFLCGKCGLQQTNKRENERKKKKKLKALAHVPHLVETMNPKNKQSS